MHDVWIVNGISVGEFSNTSRPGHHKTEQVLFGVWSIILHVSSNLPSENDLVSILILRLQANTKLTVSCKGKSGEASLYILDGTVETSLGVPGASDSSSATTLVLCKWSWGCGINRSATMHATVSSRREYGLEGLELPLGG